MTDRLDHLLERARPPEPEDDGFTLSVMERVRMEPVPIRRPRRRFFTRPIVLSAAAVLVTGGALAAVSTVTDPGPTPAAAPAPGEAELRVNGLPVPQTTSSDDEPGAASPSGAAEAASEDNVWRDGSYEWGYTSDHSAYVIDHSTGLRLDTDTYGNAATVGAPAKVTVTLRNTGDRAIAIYSPDGCALAVAAFPASDAASGDAAFDPTSPRDAADRDTWRCAGTDTQTGEQAQKWILPAGSSRTRDADVVLAGAGEWTVFGQCRCEVVSAEDGSEGGTAPLGPLTQFSLELPTDPRPTSDASSPEPPAGRALVTPPIRVTAA